MQAIFGLLDPRSRRVCVDVGAWDGVHLSNTRNLLGKDYVASSCSNQQKDNTTVWGGLLIEANEERAAQLAVLYGDRLDVMVLILHE